MPSLLGVEGCEGLPHRGDDDSLSAESVDSGSHGKTLHTGCQIICKCPETTLRPCLVPLDIGSQCNQSPSPRPHADASNPASWSRHLIQQTLMDEGLRLARMVSHDRAGKLSVGSEGAHSTGDFSNSESYATENKIKSVYRDARPILS